MNSIQWYLLPVLILLVSVCRGALAVLSVEDEVEFRKVNWMQPKDVLRVYNEQYSRSLSLGTGTQENKKAIIFYPEDRVLVNTTVTVFCLQSSDKANGYRTNSITLQILEEGLSHRRSLLAPKRNLLSHTDQFNCWNYAQESVCLPLRDCNSPARPELRTVGIITKEGWGIFQLKAGRYMQAHYQCASETQSILTSQERAQRKLSDYTRTASDFDPLEIYDTDIGEPSLTLKTSYPRGKPLSVRCEIRNSRPGSNFLLNLVLLRPPPPGIPGDSREEVLASHHVAKANRSYTLVWNGELALKSHQGLGVLCRVSQDWGKRKGRRVSTDSLRVSYMFPAYVNNPRIQREFAFVRIKSFKSSYFKTPSKIDLRQAEYAVCKSEGYPEPSLSWSSKDPRSVWILNETMFISKLADIGLKFKATCTATSSELSMADKVEVEVTVISASCIAPCTFTVGLLFALVGQLLRTSSKTL